MLAHNFFCIICKHLAYKFTSPIIYIKPFDTPDTRALVYIIHALFEHAYVYGK